MQPAPAEIHTGVATPTRLSAASRAALAIVLGSALLALSAHIQVPFWPVRLSMQSLVVLMIGLTFGGRLGAATVLAYIAEGAAGLPVFQGAGGAVAGLSYLMGPSGGYLLGFVLAAYAVGTFAGRGAARGWVGTVGVLLLGEVLIYTPGLAWLAVLFGGAKAIGLGLLPFLPAEGVKLALVAVLAPKLRRLAR